MDYTRVSLEPVKNTIRHRLDIVEVARKFWIKLKKLRKDSKELKEYGSKNVYSGDCPRCSGRGGEGMLRIFQERQCYGCLSCNWDWEYADNIWIFEFLSHIDNEEYPHNLDYEIDKAKIQKLFELFPEELAILKWHNLHRYEYEWDYLSTAEGYYPSIEQDYKELWRNNDNLEKQLKSTSDQDQRQYIMRCLRGNQEKISKLSWIIRSHQIASEIYVRRERTNKIISEQSPSDIWLESWEFDTMLWEEVWNELDTWAPIDVPYWEKYVSEGVWVHFTTPIDDIKDRVLCSIELNPWVYWNSRERDNSHYMTIPDATFHSSLVRPEFQNSLWDPIVWNYSIAYSVEENNFSIFLSPNFKTQKLHEFIFRAWKNFQNEWQSSPEFNISHVINDMNNGDIYGNRFPNSGDENSPTIPKGYREVATGSWVYSGIGMYLAFGESEYSRGKNGKETMFDKSLFQECLKSVSAEFPVITNDREYISKFNSSVWDERRRQEAKRNAWHVGVPAVW